MKLKISQKQSTIIEIPRGFGYEFIEDFLDIPKDINKFYIEPTVHTNQKIESINSDDIKDLQAKIISKNSKHSFFFIKDSEKMNEIAQNKMLKTLEEPNNNITFVLFTENRASFIDTIISRSQVLKLSPISKEDSLKIIKSYNLDNDTTQKILFIAEGLPGEIVKLATNKKYYKEQIEIIELAKKWVQGSKYDKIIIVSGLKNNRQKTQKLLEAVIKILSISIWKNPNENTKKILAKTLNAYNQISKSGNIKINLLSIII